MVQNVVKLEGLFSFTNSLNVPLVCLTSPIDDSGFSHIHHLQLSWFYMGLPRPSTNPKLFLWSLSRLPVSQAGCHAHLCYYMSHMQRLEREESASY